MRRFLFGISAIALIALAFAVPRVLHWSKWQRIGTGESRIPVSSLPPGSIVLSAASAKLTAPFCLRPATSSPGGFAAAIPQGTETPNCVGRAAFSFAAKKDATYRIWLRTRWMDCCGNSVSVAVDHAEPRTVGQDAVYGVWHWVDGGQEKLAPGKHALVLGEREDGISVDQILLTPAAAFLPTGPISNGKAIPGVRRFADAFNRSPGHGSPDWEFSGGNWHIAFSLDPNRIPHQYSLEVTPNAGQQALARVRGEPWRGLSVGCSVLPAAGSTFGIAFERAGQAPSEAVLLSLASSPPRVTYKVGDKTVCSAAIEGDVLRPQQWHRLIVDRWAWTVRVRLGDKVLLEDYNLDAAPLAPALVAAADRVVFDDVDITEIPWQGDDGGRVQAAWDAGADSLWYCPRNPGGGTSLEGRYGGLSGALYWKLPLRQVLVWSAANPASALDIEGFVPAGEPAPGTWSYKAKSDDDAPHLKLVARKRVDIDRLAWRYRTPEHDYYRIGPYNFATAKIPDPADYLDFTPKEEAAIACAPDSEKLIRKAKFVNLVGKSGEYAVWASEGGSWWVADGTLHGAGPDARLRFWQEIDTDAEMDVKVKLGHPDSVASVTLAEDPHGSVHVLLGDKAPAPPANTLGLPLPGDGKWHQVRIVLSRNTLAGSIDGGKTVSCPITRGDGGGVLLGVDRGQAQFDDLQCLVPRKSKGAWFYGFDRRETDWWRTGKTWIDHGGISCALASNWISLVAPKSAGLLIDKHSLPTDVMVAFNIEENSQWFGWNHEPTHIHYPFDHIRVCLAPAQGPVMDGYRVEIDARAPDPTELYRHNLKVAGFSRDGPFPIRYVGGHAPYRPRRNRIKLIRRGAKLTVVIDGDTVLQYTDPDPIPTSRVAIGGHHTRVNFSRIVVRALDLAPES